MIGDPFALQLQRTKMLASEKPNPWTVTNLTERLLNLNLEMGYWSQYINSWPFFIVIETDYQLLQPHHLRFARYRVVEFWMLEMVRVSSYHICHFLTVSNVFYCNRNWSLTSTTTPPLTPLCFVRRRAVELWICWCALWEAWDGSDKLLPYKPLRPHHIRFARPEPVQLWTRCWRVRRGPGKVCVVSLLILRHF